MNLIRVSLITLFLATVAGCVRRPHLEATSTVVPRHAAPARKSFVATVESITPSPRTGFKWFIGLRIQSDDATDGPTGVTSVRAHDVVKNVLEVGKMYAFSTSFGRHGESIDRLPTPVGGRKFVGMVTAITNAEGEAGFQWIIDFKLQGNAGTHGQDQTIGVFAHDDAKSALEIGATYQILTSFSGRHGHSIQGTPTPTEPVP